MRVRDVLQTCPCRHLVYYWSTYLTTDILYLASDLLGTSTGLPPSIHLSLPPSLPSPSPVSSTRQLRSLSLAPDLPLPSLSHEYSCLAACVRACMHTKKQKQEAMRAQAQLTWLRSDLERAAGARTERPWIIAYGHRPLYCRLSMCGVWCK